MAVNLEQLAASNQTAVESLLALANTALASAERVAALNLSTARDALKDTAAGAKTLMAAKDPQQALAAQSALVHPAVEKAVEYSKSILEISSESQQQFVKTLESTFAGYQQQVTELIAQASKAAPAGSEQVIAGINAAMAQANSAFANLTQMSKQFSAGAQATATAAMSNMARATKK
jgi:phasin family protein